MYTVRIGIPDPRFGNMLLEQFGGPNGELAVVEQHRVSFPPSLPDVLCRAGAKYGFDLAITQTLGTLPQNSVSA